MHPNAVEQDVQARFENSVYWSLRNLSCKFDDGILVLHGAVSSFYEMQVALTSVADIPGVERIVNEIKVPVPTAAVDAC
jgi:osmotically-inducible protein OsmY